MKPNEQKEATKGKCVNNTERRSGFNAVINVVCRVCMYRILCSAVKILEYHLLNRKKEEETISGDDISFDGDAKKCNDQMPCMISLSLPLKKV